MLTYPLALYRGDTYRRQFTVWADAAQTTAVDLTDVLVAAEIRAGTGTTPVYALALTVTLPETVAFGAGAVIVTTGGVVSTGTGLATANVIAASLVFGLLLWSWHRTK